MENKIGLGVSLSMIIAYIIAAGGLQGLLFVTICLLIGGVYQLMRGLRD